MSKIQPKQIEWPPSRETMGHLQEVFKALSAAGFVWNVDQGGWLREHDGAAFTEESLEDLCTHWPTLVRYAIKMIRGGRPGISVTIDERSDGGVTVHMNPMSLLDRVAEAAQ